MEVRLACTLVFTILGTPLLRAQSAREFDAVSVKPDTQKGPPYVSSRRADPSMLRMTGYTLKACVTKAL